MKGYRGYVAWIVIYLFVGIFLFSVLLLIASVTP